MGLFKKSGAKNDKDRPDFSNVRSGGSSTAAQDAEAIEAPQTPWLGTGQHTYTVMRRDTLSKIAVLEYGDAKQWRKIYEANKDLIEDPDLIFPGQVLRIP